MKVTYEVTPAPLHSQVMAYESYVFNVAVENLGVTVEPGEPVDESSQVRYTGRVVVSLRIAIRGRGNYDFGESTTGYTTQTLEEAEYNAPTIMPGNGTRAYVSFNYTFIKDAFEYGLKPYEDVEVTAKAAAYYEVYDQTTGPTTPFRGPEIAASTVVYYLIDETKIAYIEGKLMDMADEVGALSGLIKPEYVNTGLYVGMLEEMNSSLRDGDYTSALKTYQRYDEKYRLNLISSLTREASTSRQRAETISELERRIQLLELELENSINLKELEIDQLQARYSALSQTYQLKQAELEEAKQSLATAITAVFIASIVFFFLGRKSTTSNIFERKPREPEVRDDAAPGVR
jgi:hypothetical protein